MSHEPEMLTTIEAAAFLSVHVETLRRLARRGEIPSFKMGKDWRFSKRALLDWAERHPAAAVRCSVLVVDDEENVCRALGRALERFGCSVRWTTGGRAGLQLVQQDPPDLILLDLMMPELNGPQFLQELRVHHPELPVIIVTGFPDSHLMTQAMDLAPVMLLAKPAEAALLERTVRVALGGKVQRRAG